MTLFLFNPLQIRSQCNYCNDQGTYRIVSKTAPNYGLTVDKTSGAVTVKPYLEEAVAAKASMKTHQVAKNYEAIWAMADCSKPLPPKHQPKEKKAQE